MLIYIVIVSIFSINSYQYTNMHKSLKWQLTTAAFIIAHWFFAIPAVAAEKPLHRDSILIASAKKGYFKSVEWLVSAGADVNMKDKRGETCLMYAVKKGNEEAFTSLMQSGADPLGKDKYGTSVLWRALHAKNWNPNILLPLLKADKRVNERDRNGRTPLMVIAKKSGPDYTNIILQLIQEGADVNAKDTLGNTPLMYALGTKFMGNNDHTMTMQILKSSGANMNARNDSGRTPLMFAAMNGRAMEVSEFVKTGIDVNIRDSSGKTALALAEESEKKQVKLPPNQRISKIGLEESMILLKNYGAKE